jgi:uncharacterized membrane protein
MSAVQGLLTFVIVLAIGYGTLYKADTRDPDREVDIAGVPVRFVSLILVSYFSVFILALAFDAPGTFLADIAQADPGAVDILGMTLSTAVLGVTLKATSVGAVFSVIGAATADTLF